MAALTLIILDTRFVAVTSSGSDPLGVASSTSTSSNQAPGDIRSAMGRPMPAVFAVGGSRRERGSLEEILGMSKAGRVPRRNAFPHFPRPPHGTPTFQYSPHSNARGRGHTTTRRVTSTHSLETVRKDHPSGELSPPIFSTHLACCHPARRRPRAALHTRRHARVRSGDRVLEALVQEICAGNKRVVSLCAASGWTHGERG